MSDSLRAFKDWLSDTLPEYATQYRHFTGELIDYTDAHKDDICYNFLINFPTWWDDVLPPATAYRAQFLDNLYNHSLNQSLSGVIRDDIYLSLESHLSEIVEEVYNATGGVNNDRQRPRVKRNDFRD
jgi:hypothetical protein